MRCEGGGMIAAGQSDLRLRIGLARAALMAWKLIVIRAMPMAVRPAVRKIHQLMEAR